MKIEIPKYTRCCLCIPLRHGILWWAYTRLIFDLLIGAAPVIGFGNLCTTLVIWVLCLMDSIFIIVLIIGAHMKRVSPLKVYYYYALVATALYILGLVACFLGVTVILSRNEVSGIVIYILVLLFIETFIAVFIILSQVNLIFLVRSEFLKLQDNSVFKYVTKMEKTTEDDNEKETELKVKYDRMLEDV